MTPKAEKGESVQTRAQAKDPPSVSQDPVNRHDAARAVSASFFSMFCIVGCVAFRDPVPAYKHSAAVFLHATGRIPTPLPHPANPKRPPWEQEILKDCALRLNCELSGSATSVANSP
jgi:hypothetical protein